MLLAAVAAMPVVSFPASAQQVSVLTASVGFQTITVIFHRPAGPGPFPLIVMSHGSPRDAAARARFGQRTLSGHASAYASQGVAVAVPIRRGFGGNGGWAEGFGRCENPDYYSAAQATAAEIRAATEVAKAQPGVDASRIALIGVSAGGIGSVAAATHGGYRAVVNFAGGRGSMGPNNVCGEGELVRAFGRLGSAVPQLWIYNQNDLFFRPELARRMHAAFTAAGGRAQFIAAAAHGADGHDYFITGRGSWKPTVDRFLRSVGFLR